MEAHRISRWSEAERTIYTEVYRGQKLVGNNKTIVNADAILLPNPNGNGRMLKYSEGLETFYTPLDIEYGFEEFVTFSYSEHSYELFVSIHDAYENILREKFESLLDKFPTLQRFANGMTQLAMYVKRGNERQKLVHIVLDTVMKHEQLEAVM